MAFELIKISEFPESSDLKDWFIVGDINGISYKLSKDNLEAELGINALMQFGGAIAPASTPEPTGDFFWIATEEGTYTNFGGVVVPAGSLAVISRVDGVFTSSITTIPQPENKIDGWEAGEYFQGDQRIHNGQIWSVDVPSTTEEPGTGLDWVGEIDKIVAQNVGIEKISPSDNLGEILDVQDFSDTNVWGEGYLSSSGTVLPSDTWHYTKQQYPIYAGEYQSNIYVAGNAKFLVFDNDNNIIQVISDVGHPQGTTVHTLNIAEGASYYRTSRNNIIGSVAPYIRPVSDLLFPTNAVFATTPYVNNLVNSTKADIEQDVTDEFEGYGFKTYDIGHNFLEEVAASLITDTDVWEANKYLHINGTVRDSAGWYITKEYHRIYAGNYDFRFYLSTPNVSFHLCNRNLQVVRAFENPGSLPFTGNVDVTEEEMYIRITHRTGYPVGNIFFNNTEVIKVLPETTSSGGGGDSSSVKEVLQKKAIPKRKFPVISFINDDGHIAAYDWYLPILDSKGVKSTFACVSDWMYGSAASTHFNPEQLRELVRDGHEIASHSRQHRYLATDYTSGGTLDEVELEKDICDAKTAFSAIGIETPMFVAPFGNRTNAVDMIIRKYHKADFVSRADSEVVNGTCCNDSPLDNYLLKRVSFDAVNNTESRLQICKDAVDVCLATGQWLVFAVHSQYLEYDPTGNPDSPNNYADRRQELSDLIDYIQSLGIPIVPAGKAHELWKNQVEIGDRRLMLESYTIGMDGTEIDYYFD